MAKKKAAVLTIPKSGVKGKKLKNSLTDSNLQTETELPFEFTTDKISLLNIHQIRKLILRPVDIYAEKADPWDNLKSIYKELCLWNEIFLQANDKNPMIDYGKWFNDICSNQSFIDSFRALDYFNIDKHNFRVYIYLSFHIKNLPIDINVVVYIKDRKVVIEDLTKENSQAYCIKRHFGLSNVTAHKMLSIKSVYKLLEKAIYGDISQEESDDLWFRKKDEHYYRFLRNLESSI